eukprot:g10863.t1
MSGRDKCPHCKNDEEQKDHRKGGNNPQMRTKKNSWYVGNHFDLLTDLRLRNWRSILDEIAVGVLAGKVYVHRDKFGKPIVRKVMELKTLADGLSPVSKVAIKNYLSSKVKLHNENVMNETPPKEAERKVSHPEEMEKHSSLESDEKKNQKEKIADLTKEDLTDIGYKGSVVNETPPKEAERKVSHPEERGEHRSLEAREKKTAKKQEKITDLIKVGKEDLKSCCTSLN